VREAATKCPAPCKFTFDLSSRKWCVTWTTSVPILVYSLFSTLGPMCATDRETDVRQHHRLMPRLGGGGIIIVITRRMYWRRASIQDGQAFTSAWWHHCSETVFRDNFVIFRRRSKSIAFFGISEYFYVCLYANFQFSWWSWWSCDQLLAPFRVLYLPNAWSQTLQTSKRHTFSLGFPSVPLV